MGLVCPDAPAPVQLLFPICNVALGDEDEIPTLPVPLPQFIRFNFAQRNLPDITCCMDPCAAASLTEKTKARLYKAFLFCKTRFL